MKLYIIMWIATNYSCPWGLQYMPDGAKNLLCKKSQGIEYLMSSKKDVIEKKLQEVTGSSVISISGGRSQRLEKKYIVEEQ